MSREDLVCQEQGLDDQYMKLSENYYHHTLLN